MLRVRPEIATLDPYIAGRPIEEIAREYGIEPDRIAKLASNESPEGPFPGVTEAVTRAVATANRYPEDEAWELTSTLAATIGVTRDQLLLGSGSVSLITDAVLTVGGPGTNVIYPWPSFVMYRLATIYSGSTPKETPLDAGMRLDLEAMHDAIDGATTLIFVCNPNNPTGTIRSGAAVEEFIRSVPDSILVVVDEAYHEYVDEPTYSTAVPLALELPNVMVLRTFSKLYALAGFRIGYGIAHQDTAALLKRTQAPFAVSRLAQVAALASLGQPGEVTRRASANALGRHYLKTALDDRGFMAVESQTNFVFFNTSDEDARALTDRLIRHGVIIRPIGDSWARVTVGTETENRRFLDAIDAE